MVGKMTDYPLALMKNDAPPPPHAGKYPFDQLNARRLAKHLVIFHPDDQAVADLMAKARADMPGLADTAIVQKIVRYNPDCMFGIARKRKFDSNAPLGDGFFAILPLNVQ